MPEGHAAPAAAVVIPVFNRLNLLRETVDSLRAQTVTDAEFIVVDDGSEDETWNYLESLPGLDQRFRIIRKTRDFPRGSQSSRNVGLDECKATAVMFLDSDDLISPTCIEQRLKVLAAENDANIVVGRQAQFTDGTNDMQWVNTERSGISETDRFLRLANPVDVPWVNGGVLFRTASLRKAGARWRTEFSWDDVAFHFECLLAGMKARWLDPAGTPDFYYRNHNSERFGRVLFSPDGIRSSTRMIAWMCRGLSDSGCMSAARRHAAAASFFNACTMRAIDSHQFHLANEVTVEALSSEVLSGNQARSILRYIRGRRLLRGLTRLSYYWDRFNRNGPLKELFLSTGDPETYGAIRISDEKAKAELTELLNGRQKVRVAW